MSRPRLSGAKVVSFLVALSVVTAIICSCPGGKPQSSTKAPPTEKKTEMQNQMKTMIEKGKMGGGPAIPKGGGKATPSGG